MASLEGRFAIQIVTGNADGLITIQTYEVGETMVESIRQLIGEGPIGELIAPANAEGFDGRVEL